MPVIVGNQSGSLVGYTCTSTHVNRLSIRVCFVTLRHTPDHFMDYAAFTPIENPHFMLHVQQICC